METISSRSKAFLIAVVICLSGAALPGQMVDLKQEKYLLPPKEIADAVTAPRHLNVTLDNLGPDNEDFLIVRSEGLPNLAEYAKSYVNLGETAFDYTANRARGFQIRRDVGFELFNYRTGRKLEIKAPDGSWVSTPTWSPDGSKVAYFVHNDRETRIYVAGTDDGKSHEVTSTPVLATLVTSIEWTPDSEGIATVLIPASRPPMPANGKEADEPEARLTDPGPTPNRTYRFLMHTPQDFDLFEWLATGQMAIVNVKTGAVNTIGRPDMWKGLDVSIDGNYIRATSILKPFSYSVPVSSFGTLEAIYDLSGKKLADVYKQQLRQSTVNRGTTPPQRGPGFRGGRGMGGGRGANDRRSTSWRPDGKGLSFLQMEPRKSRTATSGEEAPDREAPSEPGRKDRVMQWLPPFDSSSMKVVYENDTRIGSVQYSEDCQTLFLTETKGNETHLFAVRLADPKTKLTIFKHKSTDVYDDPGTLMTRRTARGADTVRIASDRQSLFLSGTHLYRDSAAMAPRPFIAKLNFTNGEKKEIFLSDENVYENVLEPADGEVNVLVTSRESESMIPDSYLRDLKSGELKKLTGNIDYSPEVTHAARKRFQVERADGIKFWVSVTLPAGYMDGTKLPALFWFYPREFTDQKDYDRSAARYNKNSFPRIAPRSMQIVTLRGYALVEPDCPIIGPRGQMNNNYVADLRNNLWAVIDLLDKKEIIDRDRLAIGGHSYGAFSTANALAHTPFFKAGIAGDGNYNRTLTPLTFQSERRFLWDAREVYLEMSPLLYANQINGALLMYYGQEDSNNGTDPINSDRMFHVLNGLGKTAALYSYPYEDHGPAMRETLLDLWARWDAWLERYVKNPQKTSKPKPQPTESDDTPNQ